MKEDYCSTMKKIEEWCSQCVQRINEHAIAQKAHLVDAYTLRKQFLKKRCEEIVNLACSSSDQTEKNSFEELCAKFHNLNVQYWELRRVTHEWTRLDVIITLELEETRSADSTATLHSARRRRRQHKLEDTTAHINKTSSEKQSSDSTSSNLDHKNHSQVDETQAGTNDSVTDDFTNKCPICYMIYPRSFTIYDRQRHVNAHMDEEPN
ncbi:unnamed protein product [Adineta ricciae]|uniref:UBZ1-type domain-containing protein n=1 Tax=Adineta ricciae TaxID=249248 RepID=A0A814GFE7_ADIRI|nr:unnamed protein product [Adineta ricciae]CAF1000277.1 unnamed protein product [Adineta ricciae]